MAQQLALDGILRHQPQGGGDELVALGRVVENGPRHQQVTVHGLRVHPRQKVRHPGHIEGVHQQAVEETVVHAFSSGEGAEAVPQALQHPAAHRPVLPRTVRQRQKLLPGGLRVDGGRRDQVPQAVPVVLLHRADPGEDQLEGAPVFGDAAPELDDGALVLGPQGAGVVPEFGVHRAAAVRDARRQEGLAGVGGLDLSGLEDIEALDLIAGFQIGDPFIIVHTHSPVCL